MKKRSSLPDFHELCTPEQNHLADLVSLEIFFFFLCAVTGFLWEVFLMYARDGHYVNRGFFYGPWLPVYGMGAVLFHLLLGEKEPYQSVEISFSPRKKTSLKNMPLPLRMLATFFLTALLGTAVELAVGWLLDMFWGMRYWDYSEYLFNFHGYICLWSAIGFGVAGTLWICFFSNYCHRLWLRFSKKGRRNLNTFLLLLFVFDCAAALIFPNSGYGITF